MMEKTFAVAVNSQANYNPVVHVVRTSNEHEAIGHVLAEYQISEVDGVTAKDTGIVDGAYFHNNKMDLQIAFLVGEGRKIPAIKLTRANTGMGLRDAKQYVERIEALSRVQEV